ncbi:hypothetical protein FSARC_15034 [Fusarium sarcochroum]|uniref:Ankyrin n=1 Tax=Fusarium sarcochroum TaxID=1208366 RepID=A0A8H4WMF7_9HYPO|nr:hypothetical protein FSARC_15034 [Fusarium sarcochroum]
MGRAKLDSVDVQGQTPLSYATKKGEEGVVRYLLERGAYVESKDVKGRTPLSFGISALGSGPVEINGLLLEKGADINGKDSQGEPPLFLAVRRYRHEVAGFLLEMGADLDAKDVQGRTPLFVAVENGSIEAVKLLLDNKADRYLKDTAGRTSWSLAVEIGCERIRNIWVTDTEEKAEHPSKFDRFFDNWLIRFMVKIAAHGGTETYGFETEYGDILIAE